MHCTARLCNVLLKRLKEHAELLGREAVGELDAFSIALNGDAALIPPKGRLAPRLTKPGEMDLTTARLFVENVAFHEKLVSILQKYCPTLTVPWGTDRKIPAFTALALALRSIHLLRALWRKKEFLTDSDVLLHEQQAANFAKSWKAFGWKVTPWVHWVTSHSTHFARQCRTIFLFSSIPTEMKHRPFKLDVKNSFLGGRRTQPARCAKGLTKQVENDALDKGLLVQRLSDPNPLPASKRARR